MLPNFGVVVARVFKINLYINQLHTRPLFSTLQYSIFIRG